jgi:HlyD family secretion protein
MKKWVIALVVVAVLAAAGWFGYQEYERRQKAEELEGLQMVSATRGDLISSIGATGQVRSNQSARLAWQTSGIVEEVAVKLGEAVNADQVLASLVQSSLPQNVILAEVELINAQKALEDLLDIDLASKQAQQAVSAARLQVIEAERAVDRFQGRAFQDQLDLAENRIEFARDQLDKAQEELQEYKGTDEAYREDLDERVQQAQQAYDERVRQRDQLLLQRDQAVEALNTAKAELAKAEQQAQDLQQGPDPRDIQALEARIAAAQATLNLRRLAAPFSGVVTELLNKPGDQVVPGMQSLRLDDLSQLKVDARVSEVDINRIQPGQEVLLTFDAIADKEYRGVVSQVDRVATNLQGVIEFVVTVDLLDADEQVRPGMTAAVNFTIEQIDNVLMVPNRAVRVLDGKRVVYLLIDDELTPIEVTLGASSDTMSQLLSGDIQEGDPIVLNPPTEFESDGPPPFVQR